MNPGGEGQFPLRARRVRSMAEVFSAEIRAFPFGRPVCVRFTCYFEAPLVAAAVFLMRRWRSLDGWIMAAAMDVDTIDQQVKVMGRAGWEGEELSEVMEG